MIKRKGYLWSYYGFTKLHFWGVHIVGGLFAAAGSLLIVEAGFKAFDDGVSQQIYLLLAFAGISFLACIAIVLASIFSLFFFLGAHRLGLLDSDTHSKETQQANQPQNQ